MQSIRDQRWLVTGASRGLGRAIAEQALAGGARVACLSREGRDLPDGHGERAKALAADVTDPASLNCATHDIAEAWGGIDVVINNAGLHRGGLIEQIDSEDFAAVLASNLGGPFNVIRAALPYMTDDGGSIVNIGAVVGFRGFAGDVAYGSSKMGLAGMTQVLAMELARRAIRVNLVVPGLVMTEMTAGIAEKAREKLVKKIPLGREGKAEEIAEVVCWVAQSRYMTGSVIATDGGLMCAL